jgi:D-methionine transport system ATP-binding protein
MISIKNVNKSFANREGTVEALQDVSIDVDDGDIFGVIGFSGAGKSTLIRTVNYLEKPTTGQVIVNGNELGELSKAQLREVRKSIGMVFQQFNLLDSKTVYQNIATPLILNKVPKDEIKQRVKQLLEFVELEDKIDTYTSKLSGGQKQRVGIARALATNPSILLCDEATSALDPKTTESILTLLKKINKEFNITILLITHVMNVIRSICNRVAVMENGQVVEQGNVIDVFGNPQQEITKNFVRTVIDDTIPESVIRDLKQKSDNYEIIKLKFLGSNANESLLSKINKQFDVETTILFATVSELQGQTLGVLIISVTGVSEEIKKVEAYIEASHIEYERVILR